MVKQGYILEEFYFQIPINFGSIWSYKQCKTFKPLPYRKST